MPGSWVLTTLACLYYHVETRSEAVTLSDWLNHGNQRSNDNIQSFQGLWPSKKLLTYFAKMISPPLLLRLG